MAYIIIGIVLFLLGYLVKYKQWSWLIAGYNISSVEEKEKYDTAALCNSVGNILFVLGGIVLIALLGEFLDAGWITSFIWILFCVVIIAFIIYANTGNRFKK